MMRAPSQEDSIMKTTIPPVDLERRHITALAALMPINPTPIAAPNAARPTCKLPIICVSFLCVAGH